ncbi:GLPGLI family protein [Sphingobacterium multivorum]|uniref:GLPGLI family protein n=1 Tax=Sphingobacterium multivorum TaxID=28454 RepID=UPI003DA5020B
MKYLIIHIVLLLLTPLTGFSQYTKIISEGRIEFEKKVNTYVILDSIYLNSPITDFKEFVRNYKLNNAKIKTSYCHLIFEKNKSIFQYNNSATDNDFLSSYANDNTVFINLQNNYRVSIKNVLGNGYLLEDSIRKINWKITDEMREIAGYSCRRANAIIQDSIYVVAFYTDEISTMSGPESFSGLPGMILGVALPHEHTSWFATQVILDPKDLKMIVQPKNGRKIKSKELEGLIRENSPLNKDRQFMNWILKRISL